MFRFQTVLPYLILIVVCVCLVTVLYASSPVVTEGVALPSQKNYGRYKPLDTANEGTNRPIDELPPLVRNQEDVRNKDSDSVYLKTISVSEDESYKPLNMYKSVEQEKFTILIQTFNRTDLLMRVLNHFSAVHEVDRIIVVWNTMGEEPPYDWWGGLEPHPVEVVFLEQSVNKVRNRLQRFPEIRTEAVLMLDDDHLYATRDVEFAFRVWKQYRNKIVGFVARKHLEVSNGILLYGDFDMDSGTPLGGYVYSFVLIGASFFHRDYLEMFNSDEVPYGVHQLIDEKENCDDLAFNFMVGRHLAKTRQQNTLECVGLYVHPTVTKSIENLAISGYAGKWKNPEHFAIRSYCINALAKLYSGVPLPYCDMVLTAYFDFTRMKHC